GVAEAAGGGGAVAVRAGQADRPEQAVAEQARDGGAGAEVADRAAVVPGPGGGLPGIRRARVDPAGCGGEGTGEKAEGEGRASRPEETTPARQGQAEEVTRGTSARRSAASGRAVHHEGGTRGDDSDESAADAAAGDFGWRLDLVRAGGGRR